MLAGVPILQPTDERRRTGSHYTPRSLTEPIVRYALEPAFERLGPDATPEEVLDLKVCDPAMGSGAFLVEACRALAARLVQAWARWSENRPALPADEDEDLHARRLVAQRCLYGVDKNPMATDLAKLSLWLATLARDHEFTFLDHALKTGDSLVGLSRRQIAALHWDPSKPGLPLFRGLIRERFEEALSGRTEIRDAPDDVERAIQEARYQRVERRLSDARVLGNTVIAAFFSADKTKAREAKRQEIESWLNEPADAMWIKVHQLATSLSDGERPIRPFHWEIEFPEVFARANGGFDALTGNPPFLAGARVWPMFGASYPDWLRTLHEKSGGKAVDLSAHFYRRAFNLLRNDGAFGLLGTKTISEGDTREAGLKQICLADGRIYAAQKRIRWPGAAAVIVSAVHVRKGTRPAKMYLDHREVSGINSFLFPSSSEFEPKPLLANKGRAFRGCDIYGQGFLFSDEPGAEYAGNIDFMNNLLERNSQNALVVFPYIGGQEVSTHPKQLAHRYAINFANLPLRTAERWPELLEIVREKVKPERDKLSGYPVALRRREYWWQYGTYTPALYRAIEDVDRVLGIAWNSTYICFAFLPPRMVFNKKLIILPARGKDAEFALLQSRVHEVWALMLGSTLGVGDTPAYSPPDCLETFPYAAEFDATGALAKVGAAYNDYRATLMVNRDEGMTKIYNHFHDQRETSDDIRRLRDMHVEMDRAVLQAYGWQDLAGRAEPRFLDEMSEDDHKYQGKLFWPAEFRDEVLARLLALNAERAATERAVEPLSPRARPKKNSTRMAGLELSQGAVAKEDD